MEKSLDTIVESRKDFMISPNANYLNAKPILRTAHFLKPSLSLYDQTPISQLPSLPPAFDPKNWPLTVNFHGWRNPSKNWKEWVQKMASLHAPIWKKAGIHDAIFNSTYKIHTNSEFILGVAERWLPDTNSFVFPWGEATITLEDMLISGYSVLGSPVFEILETEESKVVREALVRERQKFIKTPARKAHQYAWMKTFMDSGSVIEHEAFLSLWLSRFVLPTCDGVVSECVFQVAVHLARGTRIALAPAVLASIYRDLSLLKQNIVALIALDADNDVKVVVTTYAPFQLVLVWVWERFEELSPEPNLLKLGEPRFARWNLELNTRFCIKNVRSLLESSKESFKWRPYTRALENWDFPKFYREEEMWFSTDSDLDDDLLSFIMCLRVSKLVGVDLNCRERYLPHRVARQLGFDQDVPGLIGQSSWICYFRPVGYVKCFIPSRLSENDVTTRYLEWWNTLEFQEKKKAAASLNRRKQDDGDCCITLKNSKPPPQSSEKVVVQDSSGEEDNLTISQLLKIQAKARCFK
ncbi:Aminotransferase-like plant mobile domain family protein [Euphorbia peplus]|nr:Aminotransferase-like plant mobile domain family protein [Euphorbia peplus]